MDKVIWDDGNNFDNKIDNKENIDKLECDVLIIGGGITGISTAYFLRNSKEKIVLIDKGKVCEGITRKSTAKISYLQGIIYQTLVNYLGKDKAYGYYKSQREAIEIINKIIKDEKIDCDFNKCSSVIFTMQEKGIKKIKQEEKILNSFGCKTFKVNDKRCVKGIKVNDTYVFNPVKFVKGMKEKIVKKIKIYEGVMAKEISFRDKRYVVRTDKGEIYAKRIVVACHYPFFLIPSLIPIRTYIKREYVNVGKIDKDKDYTAISIDKDLHSVKFYKDYLIYGSHQQRLTNKINYAENFNNSRDDFYKYFGIKPSYTWINQDIMSNDYLPFIGMIKDNLYMSVGYNAWGMTNGVLGGKIISDLILTGENEYQALFKPTRVNIPLIFNSLIGVFHYLKGYIEGIFKKCNPRYVKIDGMLYGIYIDKEKKKHIVKLICPHMKCPLVFNRSETTWDCPCHGSRFSIDGDVLYGPANHDIRVKDKKKD